MTAPEGVPDSWGVAAIDVSVDTSVSLLELDDWEPESESRMCDDVDNLHPRQQNDPWSRPIKRKVNVVRKKNEHELDHRPVPTREYWSWRWKVGDDQYCWLAIASATGFPVVVDKYSIRARSGLVFPGHRP